MARNGAGTYGLPQAAFVPGTVISSTAVNSNFSDIANALTQSISNDGQTPITANLPMSTYRHTGVGNAVARNDYAAMGQVQDGAGIWCGTAGGTANALTLTPTPAITAYAAGQVFRFTAGASPNTGATTVAVSGLTAKDIQNAGAALTGGEIAAGRQYAILYDGTQFQLSPFASSTPGAGSVTNTMLAAMAANTVKANATAGSASPTDVALAASQLLGRGATGNIAAIALGTGLSMSGTTLNSSAVFSASYTSADQTITSAGSLTLAHSLGGAPTFVQVFLKNVTAQHGYTTGMVVPINQSVSTVAGNNSRGVAVVVDGTNINVRFGSNASAFDVIDYSSGVGQTITNSNWSFFVRAWR